MRTFDQFWLYGILLDQSFLAQTLAFDGHFSQESNLEKATFSNDQSYFAFAFFSSIDPMVLLGIGVNEG